MPARRKEISTRDWHDTCSPLSLVRSHVACVPNSLSLVLKTLQFEFA